MKERSFVQRCTDGAIKGFLRIEDTDKPLTSEQAIDLLIREMAGGEPATDEDKERVKKIIDG